MFCFLRKHELWLVQTGLTLPMKNTFLFLLLLSFFQPVNAAVRLPAIVRDSMVLQRNTKVNIWGWADENEKLTITFAGKKYRTRAGADGKWLVVLNPLNAGGPYTMTIDASNTIVLNNILMGDVWLCSGQSNMVHQLELHRLRYANEIAEANYPNIRHFHIAQATDLMQPKEDITLGYWKSANPSDVKQFSTVAYFFAKTLYDKYKVPIGLINASVGGTPIEAWTSQDGLKNFPALLNVINKNKDTGYVNATNRRAALFNQPLPESDKGMMATPWFSSSYNPVGWQRISVPGYWEDQGVKDLNGIVWYRKEIDLPASFHRAEAFMELGRIVDADVAYINGKRVGSTTYQYPRRRYSVPAGLLKEGKNLLVVRVTNYSGKGGFVPDKPYYLATTSDTVLLTGYWQYKVGDVFKPQKMEQEISLINQPAALFNAMISPVKNFSVKGILWYQGESNIHNASSYHEHLTALIHDWRTQWKQKDLPFLFVQLPNFQDVQYLPSESDWAVFRDQQLQTKYRHGRGHRPGRMERYSPRQ
jgi:sialate O-acetylesterase